MIKKQERSHWDKQCWIDNEEDSAWALTCFHYIVISVETFSRNFWDGLNCAPMSHCAVLWCSREMISKRNLRVAFVPSHLPTLCLAEMKACYLESLVGSNIFGIKDGILCNVWSCWICFTASMCIWKTGKLLVWQACINLKVVMLLQIEGIKLEREAARLRRQLMQELEEKASST